MCLSKFQYFYLIFEVFPEHYELFNNFIIAWVSEGQNLQKNTIFFTYILFEHKTALF